MQMGSVVLPGAVRTEQGPVLAVLVQADELLRKAVVLTFARSQLEVCDHAV